MARSDYRLVMLVNNNLADRPVKGLKTKTNYGYRHHGSKFLMHVDDIPAHTMENVKLQVKVISDVEPEVKVPVANPPKPEPKEPEPEPAVVLIEDVPAASSITLLTEKQLVELEGMGVLTVQDIIRLGVEGMVGVKGIGEVRAGQILDQAAKLLSGENTDENAAGV